MTTPTTPVDHTSKIKPSSATELTSTDPIVGFTTDGQQDGGTRYPKDGINDHVIAKAPTVNPELRGTKCAAWYRVAVAAAATVELRLRLRPAGSGVDRSTALGPEFEEVVAARRVEAEEFYAELTPPGASLDEAKVMRQAFAGMLWSKQFYCYDVARWLDGDPGQPAPPSSRLTGRNSRWRSFNAFDVMSMPDKWEYPWFASWDLAFHCVALAHVDPSFAKRQLLLVCREWFQHPMAPCPPTNGISATSTRRCRRGLHSRSSRSTAGATWTASAAFSTSCWSTSPGG